MNTIKFALFLSSVVLLISCGSKNIDKSSKSNVKQEVTTTENSFDDFIKKFSKDKLFQLSRIKFPVTYNYTNEDDETGAMSTKQIQKNEWKAIDFVDKSGFGEAVEVSKEVKDSNTIDLLVKGVDTGLSITYCFKKEYNTYYLVKIIDYSN